MRSTWHIAILAASVVLMPSRIHAAPYMPNPVTYQGCLTIDPTACGTFFFRKVLGAEGFPTYWYFVPPPFVKGSNGTLYFVLEDFSYTNSTGSCRGRTFGYFFMPGNCVIERRFDLTYSADVAWFTPDQKQFRTDIQFAAVAPEPATIGLVATGLGALGAGLRRRRKRPA